MNNFSTVARKGTCHPLLATRGAEWCNKNDMSWQILTKSSCLK